MQDHVIDEREEQHVGEEDDDEYEARCAVSFPAARARHYVR